MANGLDLLEHDFTASMIERLWFKFHLSFVVASLKKTLHDTSARRITEVNFIKNFKTTLFNERIYINDNAK